jgi:acetylglutamate kinase
MAVSVAGALRVDKLLVLTDVEGVKGENNVVYSTLNPDQCRELIDSGIASGGMRAKLESAMEALQTGTAEVVIAPGATPGIVRKLLAGEPAGTRLIAPAEVWNG